MSRESGIGTGFRHFKKFLYFYQPKTQSIELDNLDKLLFLTI